MGSEEEAGALVCPGCGAPVGFGDRLCAHCGAELATVRCGACFALGVAGSKACAQCGAALGLEGMQGPLGIPCPRCAGTELVGVRVGEHDVGECLRCTGLFVEHPVLERITRRAEERGGLRLRPLEVAASPPERTAYLPCPRCGAHMNRKNFGERSGVIVDVCGRHGVWFDRDELARTIEFVDAGGLQRAREAGRRAVSIRRLRAGEQRPDVASLPSYDLVASFLASLLRGD